MTGSKNILGYKNYIIAKTGTIRNTKTKRTIELYKNNDGYYCVDLTKNDEIKTFLVHRLIIQSNYPWLNIGKVWFKDGNKDNLHLDNLSFHADIK